MLFFWSSNSNMEECIYYNLLQLIHSLLPFRVPFKIVHIKVYKKIGHRTCFVSDVTLASHPKGRTDWGYLRTERRGEYLYLWENNGNTARWRATTYTKYTETLCYYLMNLCLRSCHNEHSYYSQRLLSYGYLKLKMTEPYIKHQCHSCILNDSEQDYRRTYSVPGHLTFQLTRDGILEW